MRRWPRVREPHLHVRGSDYSGLSLWKLTPHTPYAVSAFARRTGDLASLSRVDLRVLALTWMLEKECNGAHHLRTTPPDVAAKQGGGPRENPGGRGARVPREGGAASGGQSGEKGHGELVGPQTGHTGLAASERSVQILLLPAGAKCVSVVCMSTGPRRAASEALEGGAAAGNAKVPEGAPAQAPAPATARGWLRLPGWAESAKPGAGAEEGVRQDDGGDDLGHPGPSSAGAGPRPEDDDLPWITVDNLREAQRADSKFGYFPDRSTDVCCMTTDFAMQNVIMRMGMRLLSTSGMVMRSVKQWAQQCSGCFRITRDMGRQYCDHCGNNTLIRIALVVNRDGSERVLPIPKYVRDRIMSTRGTRYAIPLPKQGRNAGNAVTSEDALAEVRTCAAPHPWLLVIPPVMMHIESVNPPTVERDDKRMNVWTPEAGLQVWALDALRKECSRSYQISPMLVCTPPRPPTRVTGEAEVRSQRRHAEGRGCARSELRL